MSSQQRTFEAYDDLDISHHCVEGAEKYFAQVIGCVEDILMDDNFLSLHAKFMEEHWHEFDDSEENKLIYTEIFQKYTETIEKFIEKELMKAMPQFNMPQFERELRARQNELDGEVFEILSTFSDFILFKEKFLDYKAVKEGRTVDLSREFSVTKCELACN